jgi:hypothetical protein
MHAPRVSYVKNMSDYNYWVKKLWGDDDWEEKVSLSDFDDYKVGHVAMSDLREYNSKDGWIYIGFDHGIKSKIGMTKGRLVTRSRSPQNTDYEIYVAFKVKVEYLNEIPRIEAALIAHIESKFPRINHKSTGRPSEWFEVTAVELEQVVKNYLTENSYREMLSYEHNDRYSIMGWRHGMSRKFTHAFVENPVIEY